MSIASEISRISGNVSDALDAIEDKGVTIPAGANSDDLADLIAQISSGGGSAITVSDTTDTHGGIIREITAVNISDTTAVASDVAQGKYFYTAAGVKTQGTASGGGGSSIEYETGTYTPSSNSAQPTIDFANPHTSLPVIIVMSYMGDDLDVTNYTNYQFIWLDTYTLWGVGIPYSSSAKKYAKGVGVYRQTTTAYTSVAEFGPNKTPDDPSTDYGTWVSTTGFRPMTNGSSRYWRSGMTYKWLAIWAPTA